MRANKLFQMHFTFVFMILLFIKTFNCALDFSYHHYDSITNILKNYATQFPTKTYLYSIGKSVQNRELWVLVLSDSNPDKHIPLRPEAKYIGNMHGNEATSKEILLHFIDYMLNNQNTDSSVDYLMKNTRIHVLVSLNPDGFEISYQPDCGSVNGRYNANDFDLNRNFPDLFECNTDELQIETIHVINWLKNNNFLLSANFHSGSVVANYPYDNYAGASLTSFSRDSLSDDNDLFKSMAKNYSFSHSTMRNDPCGNGFIDGITNGARWYPIIGGMQDYNYWMRGCYELTIEITCCKQPDASQLQGIWLENKNALINYMKLANTGVRGIIKFYNNEPAVNISIQINTLEPIFKTNEQGEYYRILLPGSYVLKVLLDCTEIYRVNINVPADSLLTILNITLDQTSYNSYKAKMSSLNNDAKFCTISRQPIQCNKANSITIPTATEPNLVLNSFFMNKPTYYVFALIIPVILYFY